MDYVEFESIFHRRGPAAGIAAEIRTRLAASTCPADGVIPTAEQIGAWRDELLPTGRIRCLTGEHTAGTEPADCPKRCTATYWRVHSEDVARNMSALADVTGGNVELWRATGLVHDLDYLDGPHHDASVGSDVAHPLGIVRRFLAHGCVPELTLAVLEHSPHLGLEPRTPLSCALVLCDEHATMTAYGLVPDLGDEFAALTSVLRPARSRIGGYVRDDMQQRARAAARGLAGAGGPA